MLQLINGKTLIEISHLESNKKCVTTFFEKRNLLCRSKNAP